MEGLPPTEAEVGLVPASASGDATLVDGLTALVNEVYAVAEEGLWLDGVARTTSAELAGLIRASELAVARRAGAIVGCVRIQRLDDYRGQFGMLAANLTQRGTGIGRALLRRAARHGQGPADNAAGATRPTTLGASEQDVPRRLVHAQRLPLGPHRSAGGGHPPPGATAGHGMRPPHLPQGAPNSATSYQKMSGTR